MRGRLTIVALALLLAASTARAQRNPRDSGLVVEPVRGIYGHLLEGRFGELSGLYFDPYRRELYVCDAGSRRIAIVDDRGVPTFSFGSSRNLVTPRHVVVDRSGRMVVADSGYRGLRMFDYDGAVLPDLDLSEVPEAGQPLRALALAFGPGGELYVLDGSNRRLIVLTLEGRLLRVQTAPPGRADLLRAPVDVDVGPGGEVVVADAAGLPVQVYAPDGTFLRGWGDHDVGLDSFSLPSAVAIDGEGRILVADTLRQDVKIFSPDGRFLTNFGGFGTRPGQLLYPVDVTTDREGRVFVAERAGRRVQIYRVK